MEIIFIVCSFCVLDHCLIISYFIFGIKKTKKFEAELKNSTLSVSVIIAARNEEKNIKDNLHAVLSQQFSNYEVILVNDHSDDTTQELVKELVVRHKILTYLKLDDGETGKKSAITKGINAAKGELIVLTDADCLVSSKWLSSIVLFYEKEKPDLILLPVFIKSENSFFGKMQELESLSLMAVTAASASTCG